MTLKKIMAWETTDTKSQVSSAEELQSEGLNLEISGCWYNSGQFQYPWAEGGVFQIIQGKFVTGHIYQLSRNL